MARKSSKAAAPKAIELTPPTADLTVGARTVDYKLRIREDLRARIEHAAETNHVSANREMVNRLTESFEYKAARSNEAIAADMEFLWLRYAKVFHDLSTRGDLVRAAETLVEAIEQLPAATQKPLKEAIARVKSAVKVIDIEAATAMRRFNTTGEGR